MVSSIPVFEAEHLLGCQNNLGESVTWDARAKLLHWIDIEKAEIHSLDPVDNFHWVERYPDLNGIGCIVLRKDEGFIGNSVHDIVLFPRPVRPESPSTIDRKITRLLTSPVAPEVQELRNSRLNDGACDKQGRYWTGNLTHPVPRSSVWRLDQDGKCEEVFTGVCISNGIEFSPDGRTMYHIDTIVPGIYQYDYDTTTGTPNNKRLFASTPEELRSDRRMSGLYDGLCVDAAGNVWAAELGSSTIIGFRPDGSVICAVRVPQCTTATICCFGGENLDMMYITSGHSKYAIMGDVQEQYPWSGDLFQFSFEPGTEARKLLGDEWSGGERNRYDG